MPTLELTDQQVVALMKQLPPDQKRMALLALAEDTAAQGRADGLLSSSNPPGLCRACPGLGQDVGR